MVTEELVKKAVVKVWDEIGGDVGPDTTVDDAVELCLDADRPVTFGAMTKQQYEEMCLMDFRKVDKWAAEALKGLV